MRALILLTTLLLFSTIAFAQKGTIEGKITDAHNGLPLSGVSVVDKNTGKGVISNSDGRYIIHTVGKTISLIFSYDGVTQQVDEIEIEDGKVTTQNLVITPKTKTEEVVVVRASSNARKESAAALLSFQKNTNTVASVISSETIKRSPDKNTGEVLKRIPGASIQEGKFIVIRGLADRYNQAMLNGILLTSTEPDRKTFSFDLIPSSMIDNIIINKAFVPEYPGEWAGGLIQVNTKDIPAKNFLNIQLGTGFNTQTVGKNFLKDKGGKGEWLGKDDGTRALPKTYSTKSAFDMLNAADKTTIGKNMRNAWVGTTSSAPLNTSVQVNGGFSTKLFHKKIGGNFGVTYNKTGNYIDLGNYLNKISSTITVENAYNDDRYRINTTAGVFGSLAIQLNNNNKIALKSIANINTNSSVTQRYGEDITRWQGAEPNRASGFVSGTELFFKQHIFFTVQANGEHNISKPVKLKWYGAFNILDGHSPDQRRLLYDINNDGTQVAAISNTLSQQSGSRIFQSLNDYIYTAGGDLSYSFNWLDKKQTLKGGYMLQIKDRLYDAKLFANYLRKDNLLLRSLPPDLIFAADNFGNGSDDKFGFDAIKASTFRYLANTILNAGFFQIDNQFSNSFRLVWGARVEHYDQLVGSVKTWDPRHTYTKVLDVLPGLNATLKLNNKNNIRFSASQTVIRPELRELSSLNLYDFELNASVQGNPDLERTKISNIDLRYERYSNAGETISIGAFYKYFDKPIEQLYNEGSGGSSTFTYQNPKKARAYGIELEFRKKLDFATALKNFTFQANGAYINSKMSDKKFNVNRALQGQSPYLINLGLMYDHEKSGTAATLLFNQIGERIYLVGDISAGAGSPDIYEAPRPLLDFQVSKKILKNKMEIKLNVSDILNKKQTFYQNTNDKITYQKGSDLYRFTRRYGTTYGLTVNYAL